MMKTDFEDYKEMMYDVRRAIANEKEKMSEQAERLMGLVRMDDATDELLSEIEDLKDENEKLTNENERRSQGCRNMASGRRLTRQGFRRPSLVCAHTADLLIRPDLARLLSNG